MELIGKKGDRGKAYFLGSIGIEIIFQGSFEPFQDPFVLVVPGNELAIIKTITIIQKELNVGSDKFFTVLVHALFEFIIDFVQTIQDYFFFMIGYMERLVRIVPEIIIGVNALCQLGPVNQVRMKSQCMAHGLVDGTVRFHFQDLPRGYKDQGSFLVVVILTAIAKVTFFDLL